MIDTLNTLRILGSGGGDLGDTPPSHMNHSVRPHRRDAVNDQLLENHHQLSVCHNATIGSFIHLVAVFTVVVKEGIKYSIRKPSIFKWVSEV